MVKTYCRSGTARLLPLVLLLLLAGAADATTGRDHALLVGVSEYPELDSDVQLRGPRNDVMLWRDFLQDRGVASAQMRVLADGVADAELPTRQAILDALAELEDDVEDGDTVFMMFAGHGAQQPASEASLRNEPDGLDEIFLPRDASGWSAPKQAVENAIVDTEFKEAIDAIRGRGAFVWAVFDTCHSATMTRAVRPEGVRYRQASPESLGIPREALDAARRRAPDAHPTRTRGQAAEGDAAISDFSTEVAGGLVAFYAAQSTQETPEFPIPAGSEHARDHGIFSYTLYQILSENRTVSYRQVVESVIQRYQSMPAVSTVPMAEGTDLDGGVFGADADRVRQWRMSNNGRRLELAAGELQGLGVGSILAVVRDAADGDDQTIAHVQVESADLTSARARPIAFDDSDAVELRRLPANTYARPVSLRMDFTLRAQLRDGTGDDVCETPATATREAVAALQASDSDTARRLQWVASAPDVWLCQTGERVHVVDGNTPVDDESGELFSPDFNTSGVPAEELTASLDQAFARVIRVRNLLRIATSAGGADASVDTALHVRRLESPDDPACDILESGRTREDSVRHQPGVLLELEDGDCISLVVTNTSRSQAADVTILFVDSNYGIATLWPSARELDNSRIEAGGRISIGEFEAYPDTLGRDQLIVLAIPVEGASQPADLSFLAQDSLQGTTRSATGPDSLEGLLMDAGFSGTRTRSFRQTGRGGVSLDATVFPTRVVPAR